MKDLLVTLPGSRLTLLSSSPLQLLQLRWVCGRRSAGLQQLRAVQRGHVGGGHGGSLHEALLREPLGRVLLQQGQIGACQDRPQGGAVDCCCILQCCEDWLESCSGLLYYLMYRYICIGFGSLSVIVSWTGWIFFYRRSPVSPPLPLITCSSRRVPSGRSAGSTLALKVRVWPCHRIPDLLGAARRLNAPRLFWAFLTCCLEM